jgi:two-component system sensor histidine kinase BaeS
MFRIVLIQKSNLGYLLVKVQYKLFSITLIASLLLVSLMTGLAQWSLDKGLLDHVNKRAAEQYGAIIEPLSEIYLEHGTWQVLRQQPQLWRTLKELAGIKSSNADRGQPPQHPPERGRFNKHPQETRPLNPRQPRELREPRGFKGPPGFDRPPRPPEPRESSGGNSRDPSQRRMPPPPRENKIPLAIFDIKQQKVVGFAGKKEDRQQIPIYINGKIEGYLVYVDREHLIEDYDLDISSELSKNLWWIAAIMILLSASLALPFSKLLIRPIRPIVETLNKLAGGDLSSRVITKGKDEIAQVGNDVNYLADSLIESENTRKRWLANISHELRTPLTIMRGELEAMLDGVREIKQEHIQSAHQEALHLQRLVEDLYQLTSSDIGALSYHKQSLDFVELVEGNIEHLKPLILQANLALDFNNTIQSDTSMLINADSQRISQVLHNLIQNSIKYTHAPGKLSIRLSCTDQFIQLNIEDSAPGVKVEELEKIFNHLYRAEVSRNRKTGGSGLGLAISKKIIDGHDGTLQASLSPLGGVSMLIHIPLVIT